MTYKFFDTFNSRVIVEGKLVTLGPLHIGAPQNSISPLDPDNMVIKDLLGNPFIPGASLKGVMRSFTEQVLRGGFGNNVSGLDICLATSGLCLDGGSGKLKEIKAMSKNAQELAENIYQASCDVCRIFGGFSLAAKIQVRDLSVDKASWIGNYEARSGVGIDRETGTKRNGVLFDFEIVPPGTAFNFEVVIENASAKELENALISIRALKMGMLVLGGKTSRGLGKVELVEEKIYHVDRTNLGNYLVDKANLPAQKLSEYKGGEDHVQ